MPKTPKSLKRTAFSKPQLIIFVLIFAAIGGYLLLHSFAAGNNANLWIDPNGGTCTRQTTAGAYNDAQACASFTAAYNAASGGDTIYVKAGTYGDQNVPVRSIGTSVVTISAAPGEIVNTGGIGVSSSYVTINGFNGGNHGFGANGLDCSRTGVTFSNNILAGVGATITSSCGNITLIGNDISGTNQCASGGAEDSIQFYGRATFFGDYIPNNIVVKNNYIHDMANAEAQCGSHADGMQAFGCQNCMFDGNKWDKTDTSFIAIYSPNSNIVDLQNITVQNNSFGSVKDPGGGVSMGGQPCSTPTNFLIQNNTFLGDTVTVDCTGGGTAATIRNNIFMQGEQYGLCLAYNWVNDYNIYSSSQATGCGTHFKHCTPTFADATHANMNVDLAASDTCAKDYAPTTPGTYPATDISGKTRPQGTGVDVGAAEAGYTCTQTISPGANLATTISSAAGGSIICLNAGTYGATDLSNVSKSSNVMISPVNGAAVTIGNVHFWNTSHIIFDGSAGAMQLNGASMDTTDDMSVISNNLALNHITWTDGILMYLHGTNQNISVDSGVFDNLGTQLYEGRFSVRGYPGSGAGDLKITNSHFGNGGCSDGVQLVGNAYGVQIGPGNEFTGIVQSGCAAHADPIQPYGTDYLVVTGNYFHDNGDGTGGLEDFDSAAPHTTVTNNVFVRTPGGYPWSIAAGGAQGWLIQHNVIAGGGTIAMGSGKNNQQSAGNVVRDNIFLGGGGLNIDASPNYGTNDHNLNIDKTGTSNLTGTPTFTGGSTPGSFAGYALTTGSIGHNAASDGKDIGVDFTSIGSLPTFPIVTLSASPSIISSGTSSTLTWSSTNATSCTASGAWSGSKAIFGNQSVSPTTNSTYTLSCTGPGGSGQSSATITVTPPGQIIIGEPNILSTGDNGNGNILSSFSATLSQTATIQSMSFYVTNAAGKVRLGIYDATGPSGDPGALKAYTAEITPVANSWNTANVVTQVSLSPGTYWLAFLVSDNNLGFVKTTDATGLGSRTASYTYGLMPATFTTPTTSFNTHKSLYATLNTAGGGGSGPTIGDFNSDGHVNAIDLSTLLSHYGSSGTPTTGDCNTDNLVNAIDLSVVLSHYGL